MVVNIHLVFPTKTGMLKTRLGVIALHGTEIEYPIWAYYFRAIGYQCCTFCFVQIREHKGTNDSIEFFVEGSNFPAVHRQKMSIEIIFFGQSQHIGC